MDAWESEFAKKVISDKFFVKAKEKYLYINY